MFEYRSRELDRRATEPLELVHSDLAGPLSLAQSMYVMSFVDDYSGFIFLYFLKFKSDAVDATKHFLADLSPSGGVRRLKCDIMVLSIALWY